jgi:hypothetical protein
MNYKKICIIIILVLFSISAYSQIDSTFKDTIKEITIYEYDTVYLQPDTIRLTDTIIEMTITKPVDEDLSLFSSPVLNHWGVSIYPFIEGSNMEQKISDSLYSQTVINLSIYAHLDYQIKKFLLSFGLGFTPYHEKHHYRGTYYSSNIKLSTDGTYDSLLINKEYVSNYYFYYLNMNMLFGRKLKLTDKLSLNLNAACIIDFLFGYKQGNTDKDVSSARKIDVSFAFVPQIVFKVGEKSEFFISPFYQHSLIQKNKSPYTSFQKMGIGLGFKINFKKS